MGALTDLPMSMPVILGWAAWLAAGLALVVWARKAGTEWAASVAPVARQAAVRPKSAVRPPRPAAPPADAFGELQAMLDPPNSVARRPGDGP